MVAQPSRYVDCFPRPFEDESLFSVCSRFHVLSGSQCKRSTAVVLMGYPTAYRGRQVQAGLNVLEVTSGGALCCEESTLRARSILRAYLPLIPFDRRVAVMAAARATNLTRMKAHCGLSKFNEAAGLLKYCDDCVEEQLRELGVGYWKTSHQLPGVWLCTDHKRLLRFSREGTRTSLDWVLPHYQQENAEIPDCDVEQTLKLVRLKDVVTWISDQEFLDIRDLHIMLRIRLRRSNLCRNEVRLLTVEVKHLGKMISLFYSALKVPDVTSALRDGWFENLFKESRHYNPLTWALVLSFCGDTSWTALTDEYLDARNRRPQPSLFGTLRVDYVTRSRAPLLLYGAVDGASSKMQAVIRSGYSESEVNRWFVKDPGLGAHWRETTRARKRLEAISTIATYLEEYPESKRTDVLRHCNQAYRWLELNDKNAFQSVVPGVQQKYDRQLKLDF
jgi:hypothetical protein